ncbi:MAG: hypothetical protein KAI22_04905, partial [Gammaproteobacteria bacterium]|nr:hypothetical protein [Gammaproteobacteria bacterium]
MIASKIFPYSLTLLLPIVFTFIISNCQAEEQNVNPGINNYYYDAKFEQWLATFESPGREVYDKKAAIV